MIETQAAYDRYVNLLRELDPGWTGPVTPPPLPPLPPLPPDWPVVTLREVYRSTRRNWNVSFHGDSFPLKQSVVALYKSDNPRNASAIEIMADGRSIWGCDSETLQAPADGIHCAAEKGKKGAPKFAGAGCEQGHKTARKISICTGMLAGRAVVFHADQDERAVSFYDDCVTGKTLGKLHLTGAVVSAVPFGDVLLCALDGGEKMTVVDTVGREYPMAVRKLRLAADGRILAGCQDGHVRSLLNGQWFFVTRSPLDGRVMDVIDEGPWIFATTDKGSIWCVRADGATKQIQAGEVDYGSGSWFGPAFGRHGGKLGVAVKVKAGSGFACVVRMVDVA